MNRIAENCKRLCGLPGVAGYEKTAAEEAAQLLRAYIPDAHTDGFGNVVGLLPSKQPGAPTLLLDAHIDEIGLIVTSIDDKGYLKFDKCGGVDRRLLAAQRVTVHGRRPVRGIIGSKPPHLESKEEAGKAADFPDLYIDVGYSKKEAEQWISLGDRITFDSPFVELPNGRISAKALDDRCGVAAILEALELVKGEELPVQVAVQFSGREETGGQGAAIAAYRLTPDVGIAVDVSFAKSPDTREEETGNMGGGVMIGYAVPLDKALSDRMVELARKGGIPYQIEVIGGRSTGTNADEIVVTRGGVKCACLSIPQLYMHTPIEVVQLSDIEATAKLIAAFLREGGDKPAV